MFHFYNCESLVICINIIEALKVVLLFAILAYPPHIFVTDTRTEYITYSFSQGNVFEF